MLFCLLSTPLITVNGTCHYLTTQQYSMSQLDRKLVAAVRNWNFDRVQRLLQQGASPNAVFGPDRTTALHIAAAEGSWRADIVQHLLDAGADTEARNSRGSTAVHLAAARGDESAVKALLEHGASATVPDNQGDTPLHYAARAGKSSLMYLLTDAGADIDAVNYSSETPLHCACLARSNCAVKQLLPLGAAVHKRDAEGRMPLHVAAAYGLVSCVELLLDAGAPVTERDSEGMTPLLSASKNGHTGVVKMLLQANSDPDAHYNSGNTVLHLAAIHGARSISDLVQMDAFTPHINTRNSTGQTPLHVALEHKQGKFAWALLAAGADPDALYGAGAVDGQGHSIPEGTNPLQRAVQLQLGFSAALPLLATRTNLRRLGAHQMLQGRGGDQQQPGSGVYDPASIPAAVGGGLYMLLQAVDTRNAQPTHLEQAVSCLYAVREVLGPAAVGLVLDRALQGGSYYCATLGSLLLQALHNQWLAALQARGHIVHRLQQLVVGPKQRQVQQQGGPGRAAGPPLPLLPGAQQAVRARDGGVDVEAAGLAAANSGKWALYVQQLEQQYWQDPLLTAAKPYLVAVEQGPARRQAAVKGLCAALVEGQQQAGMKCMPLAEALVAALQA